MKMWENLNFLKPKLIKFLSSKRIREDDLEDVFQECCVRLIAKGEEPKNLEALIVSYSKLIIHEQYRKYANNKKLSSLTMENEDGFGVFERDLGLSASFTDNDTPESILLKKEGDIQKKILESKTYKKLTTRNKQIIKYRIVDFLEEKKIAFIIGVTPTVVEMVMYRFKKNIQDEQKRNR